MKKCKACLLPEAVPDSRIGPDGLCGFCRAPSSVHSLTTPDAAHREDLEQTLRASRNSGRGGYDCLVPLSGGKDSVYLLYKLKVEYGLRVLAYTTDIDLPAVAWSNIRTALARLDIDHVVLSPAPAFVRKLLRYLLKNQEARGAVYTVSYVYAPLFEGDAIRLAIEKDIPLILAGYSPGQPDPQRMLYEFSPRLIREEDWTPPHLKTCGEFSDNELGRFYNPLLLPADTRFPRYLAPYHAWDYDQNEVMRKVTELGLVKRGRHASPILSNYPINWLMMYSDLKHFNYNPYAPEFSALIREGKASLAYWQVMAPLVDFMIRRRVLLGREVSRCMKWLDLSDEDLHINLPEGAYDPPLLRRPAS
ncbi:MAG: hypothetical protein B7Y41_03395 [Hydrogenophilales bacterium 28-61-23]|nr:MAG: hypothetical protein B7Y41_03395 [Hydrogenophilales bacterium 28-61-23]